MQKTPANSQAGLIGGEWFTTSVDMRAAEGAKQKKNDGQSEESGSLLEMMVAEGDKLGRCFISVRLYSLTVRRTRYTCCSAVNDRSYACQ